MPAAQPLLIACAPNGAYKTRDHHSELPVTAHQLAGTAAEVMAAGARMLHLHVRDAHGRHTLDAATYRAAAEAIRAQVGDDLFIQFTSESAGIYDSAQQRQALYALSDAAPDGVSIAPRELIRAPADSEPAKELFYHLNERNILVQYVLYSTDDVADYNSLRECGVIPAAGHCVLLVAGRQDESCAAPEVLGRMIDALGMPVNWMVCAFGEHEFECLRTAAERGGQVRVGFENTLRLSTGQPAKDNRELITQLVEFGNPDGRPLADRHQAQKILGSENAD